MRPAGRRNGIRLTALALAAVIAAPASASVKDGVDAWTRGDYKGAVAQWQGPAASGDPDAQFNLGQAYKLGRGVPRDMKKAEDLYRKAAVQGHMRAADAYGLVLFEQGQRQEAMSWIKASASRGEPRAQYVLGIASFNGDLAAKDWVRAYALMTRAARSGLPQATRALTRMDTVIPIGQRQKGIALAGQLEQQAQESRETQLAAADLGTARPTGAPGIGPLRAAPAPRHIENTAVPPSTAAPVTAGADFAHPVVLPSREHRTSKDIRVHRDAVPENAAPAAMTRQAQAPAPRAARQGSSDGPWRIQLGAFANAANADALWRKVSSRDELAGLSRFDLPTGRVTRLQAGGFAAESDAVRACRRLKAAGFACLAIRR